MRRKPNKTKRSRPKARLRLPELDQSKGALLGSLRSAESQRGYRHAIDEFIGRNRSSRYVSLHRGWIRWTRKRSNGKHDQFSLEMTSRIARTTASGASI